MNEEIFKHLNSEQRKAVEATEGRVRVVAGAGSGKTRVLANRYAYLIDCVGIDPANVLCMTFTNKAAMEMRNRIHRLVNMGSANDYICTIHGLCVKILRKEIYRLGYPKNFMIIDEDDCKTLMKQVMQEFELKKSDTTVNQLLHEVSDVKGKTNYVPYLLPGGACPANEVGREFCRYLQLQRKYNALDFDDIIYFTLYILENFADAREYWQSEFDYIQVDEVQDCSSNDWRIINVLSEQCGNLFIVGDPDQAIYEWRGARPEFFVNFEADTDIILDENYRSTPNILNVANAVIKNNIHRVPKNLRTNIPANTIVVHHHATDEVAEGEWVASTIAKMLKDGCQPADFAILYRAGNQSRFIEQALMKKKLPYKIWGGIRFFERKEIKDCIAYLRLALLEDDISLRRVVNVPSRKFGKAKLEALEALSAAEGTPLFATLVNHLSDKQFNSEALLNFVKTIERARRNVDKMPISDLLDLILKESGLDALYRTDGDEERIENINELMNSIRYYEESNADEDITLEKYLQDIALYTNSDYNRETSAMKLMTIHQAKGLEFPYVFVVGLSEGIFPSYRTIRERKRNGLEEERRLMYVAITRAEQALFLTESEGYNYSTQTSKYPSRFIIEIGKELLKRDGKIDPALLKGLKMSIKNLDNEIGENTVAENSAFAEGKNVVHPIFGTGVIISVNEIRQSCEVDFNGKKRNIQWKFLTLE